jgi:hypothetical protein
VLLYFQCIGVPSFFVLDFSGPVSRVQSNVAVLGQNCSSYYIHWQPNNGRAPSPDESYGPYGAHEQEQSSCRWKTQCDVLCSRACLLVPRFPPARRRPPLVAGDVDAGRRRPAQLFCSWKKQQICVWRRARSSS